MAGRIIYLEVDDEITSAATRIRTSEATRLAVVLPYGSRVATSRINFRLLSRDALTHEKRLSIVSGDPATRALAASAGLPVFSSVAEYEASVAGLEDEPRRARAGGLRSWPAQRRRRPGRLLRPTSRPRHRRRRPRAPSPRRPPASPSSSRRSPRRRQPQRPGRQGRRSRRRRATARSGLSSRRWPSAQPRRRRHPPSSARPSGAPSRAPDRPQRRSRPSQQHGMPDRPRQASAPARSVVAGSERPGSSEPRSSGWPSSSPASAPTCCCRRRGSSSRPGPSPSAPSR